ncbi:hypothetical protein CR513_26087, partial [Mucuna pruriens]
MYLGCKEESSWASCLLIRKLKPTSTRGVEVDRSVGIIISVSTKGSRQSTTLFPILRKSTTHWNEDCEKTFQDLEVPRFTPSVSKTLSEHAFSVLVVQKQGKKQNSIYCINKVLHEAETRYQMIENLVLALVTSTRQL